MRSFPPVILVALLASSATAEPLDKAVMDQAPAKRLPLKSATSGNSCAAFGPGFVKVEGSDTCVKVGGAMQVGAGKSIGR